MPDVFVTGIIITNQDVNYGEVFKIILYIFQATGDESFWRMGKDGLCDAYIFLQSG